MAQIQFGRNSRSFEKFCDWFHVVAAGVAILLAVASFWDGGRTMRFFPLIFLDAAALNGVQAAARLRRGSASGQRLSGMALAILCLLLLCLAILCGKVVWDPS